MNRLTLVIAVLLFCAVNAPAQKDSLFCYPDVNIMIDEPEVMNPKLKTDIIFYALPNGNTIEWTAGKKMEEGDDWHYNIQHIAAQTAYLRAHDKTRNIVTVYLMAKQKAWSTWHKKHTDIAKNVYEGIFNGVYEKYEQFHPSFTVSSHSGGGSLLFNYMRLAESFHPAIKRFVFIDSSYGYKTEDHLKKLAAWLEDKDHFLTVLSYEDICVIYDGKPLVSANGGTWGRTRRMFEDLSLAFSFRNTLELLNPGTEDKARMENYRAENGRISLRILRNPNGKIYHTVLVAKNGFIDTYYTGTPREGKGYTFWGEKAYAEFIK